ncbi:MAG: PAS domain S-box protein [Leptospirales bacterium]
MRKILFIQNQVEQYITTKYILESNSYKIVSYTQAMKALRYTRDNPPDIIITDLFEPKVNAFMLIKELKKESKLKQIPIIILTKKNVEPEQNVLLNNMGVKRYIVEPIEPDELLNIIDKTFNEHKTEKKKTIAQAEKKHFSHKLIKASLLNNVFANNLSLLSLMNKAFTRLQNKTRDFYPGRNSFDIYSNEKKKRVSEIVTKSGDPYMTYAKSIESAEWRSMTLTNFTDRDVEIHSLTASEKELRTLLKHSPDQIIKLDSDLRITFLNRPSHGLTVQESIGKPLYTLSKKNKQIEIKCKLKSILETGIPVRYKTVYHPPEEAVIHYESNAAPIFTKDEISGIVVNSRDITQQVHSEKRLRESAGRFRKSFEHASIGMIMVSPEGNMVKVNPAFCKMLGYSRNEVTHSSFKSITHPDDIKKSAESVKKLVDGKIPSYSIENRYLHKNGQIIFTQNSSSLSRDPKGKPLYLISQLQEISKRKMIEAKLIDSEKRTRILSEASFEGIAIITNDVITDANENLLRMLGIQRSELIGKMPIDFVIAREADKFLKKVSSLSDNYFETTVIQKDGSFLTVDVLNRNFLTEDQNIRTMAFRDSSERLDSENTLKEYKELLDQAQKIAQIGSWSYDIGNQKFTLSDQVFNIFQMTDTEKEIIKSDFTYLFKFIHPEDRNFVEDAIRKAKDKFKVYNINHRFIDKQGIERIIHQEAAIVNDKAENALHLVGTIQDITEIKTTQAELMEYKALWKALSASERRLKIVLEGARLGSWEADLNERIVSFDEMKCIQHGIKSKGKVLSFSKYITHVHSKDISKINTSLLDIYRGKKDDYKVEYRTRDGKWLLAIAAVTRRDENKKPWKLSGVTVDINEIKIAQNELLIAKQKAEGADRLKSTFLANMSHELRTPMNAILGYSRFLSRGENLSSKQKNDIEIINRSGVHLLNLINDVLSMSQIEAGRAIIHLQDFNFRIMLHEIEELVRYRVEQKGVKFITTCDKYLPQMIKGDKQKLHQVLLNLLNNSEKFTNKGYVHLRVKKVDETTDHKLFYSNKTCTIEFEIEDTGKGIPESDKVSIFNPFHHASNKKTSDEGTGLGLAISKQYVQLMGGNLQLKAKADKGAIFHFKINVEVSDKKGEFAESTTDNFVILSPGQPSYKILVVENNNYNRRLLVRLLGDAGFIMEEAVNGEEGIKRYKEWNPHLIVMDMRMPVMDGYMATKKIRKMESESEHTPILSLTANAFDTDQKEILEAGCDEFIRKPFHDKVLFDLIAKHLGVSYQKHTSVKKEKKKVTATHTDLLSPENLEEIPLDHLNRLVYATENLDVTKTQNVIKVIETNHQDIAFALRSLAKEFKYNQIWTLVQNALRKNELI